MHMNVNELVNFAVSNSIFQILPASFSWRQVLSSSSFECDVGHSNRANILVSTVFKSSMLVLDYILLIYWILYSIIILGMQVFSYGNLDDDHPQALPWSINIPCQRSS